VSRNGGEFIGNRDKPTGRSRENGRYDRYGVEPGQISAGLGPLLALLGIQSPFDTASGRLANELLLIGVSDNSVRKGTQLMGQLQAEFEASQKRESEMVNVPQARAQAGKRKRKRLYGGIDGTIVPIRKEWRELKTATWYVVEEQDEPPSVEVGQQTHLKAKALSYSCAIATAQAFGQLRAPDGRFLAQL
jgi:hypothetical protein